MKILVFGTGTEYNKYKKWFADADIAALVDNDTKKQGTEIDNHPVISPRECLAYEADRIYIMSSLYIREMTNQLYELGVLPEKIYYLSDLAELGMEYQAPVIDSLVPGTAQKKIALLSDNLQLSGAQFALLHAAALLQKNGYPVMMASPESGKLLHYIRQAQIPYVTDERLRTGKINDLEWLREFDLIIVNTVLNYPLLLERDTRTPVIWWLHETEYFYRMVLSRKIEKIDAGNLHLYAVSNLAKQPLQKIRKDFYIDDLLVCVKEEQTKVICPAEDKKKLIFAVIGVVCELKGQDIVLGALDLLSAEENEKIEIWLIGRDDADFIKNFGKAIISHKNVRKFGELEKSDLEKLYGQIDVIVCASRSENLCMAVLEGAAHEITPLISTAAAICDYFTDRWDGMIFLSGNERDLAEKMRWCIQNTGQLKQMGRRAHEVYKNNFSESVFEQNLLCAVGKALESCTIRKNT